MKLLITTQALDLDDPVLSAYHGWVVGLASFTESVEVICLKEGRHELPSNVTVHTLGKETMEHAGMVRRLKYALRFLKLSWKLRGTYDAVFVHMNEEYLLISGWLWRMLGKRVYLWRNHYAGSFLTDIAVFFCNTVFCTSKHSYTARFKKTKLMPVGVNVERFTKGTSAKKHSILFFSRISPSKRPEMFIEALGLLKESGVAFSASIVGSPLPENEAYYRMLQAKAHTLGLANAVIFLPGVSNDKAVEVFQAHEIFVNTSPSGMFDKMLFEAASSGCIVLTTSEDFKEMAGEQFWFANSKTLAERLEFFLINDVSKEAEETLQRVAQENSFARLMEALKSAVIPSK